MPARTAHILTLILTLLALPALTGCGSYARIKLTSPLTGATLSPNLTTRVYSYADENTVDIYLSDLTPEQLGLPIDPDPANRPVGQIVHIHMFIRPSPGKTPIEPQASNCSIRHLILAPGATGLYGGGGFLLPSGSASSGTFGPPSKSKKTASSPLPSPADSKKPHPATSDDAPVPLRISDE